MVWSVCQVRILCCLEILLRLCHQTQIICWTPTDHSRRGLLHFVVFTEVCGLSLISVTEHFINEPRDSESVTCLKQPMHTFPWRVSTCGPAKNNCFLSDAYSVKTLQGGDRGGLLGTCDFDTRDHIMHSVSSWQSCFFNHNDSLSICQSGWLVITSVIP